MELIISILMALGFIHTEKQEFDLNKFRNTDTYQKVYSKAGDVDLDQNPQAWAEVVEKL